MVSNKGLSSQLQICETPILFLATSNDVPMPKRDMLHLLMVVPPTTRAKRRQVSPRAAYFLFWCTPPLLMHTSKVGKVVGWFKRGNLSLSHPPAPPIECLDPIPAHDTLLQPIYWHWRSREATSMWPALLTVSSSGLTTHYIVQYFAMLCSSSRKHVLAALPKYKSCWRSPILSFPRSAAARVATAISSGCWEISLGLGPLVPHNGDSQVCANYFGFTWGFSAWHRAQDPVKQISSNPTY